MCFIGPKKGSAATPAPGNLDGSKSVCPKSLDPFYILYGNLLYEIEHTWTYSRPDLPDSISSGAGFSGCWDPDPSFFFLGPYSANLEESFLAKK